MRRPKLIDAANAPRRAFMLFMFKSIAADSKTKRIRRFGMLASRIHISTQRLGGAFWSESCIRARPVAVASSSLTLMARLELALLARRSLCVSRFDRFWWTRNSVGTSTAYARWWVWMVFRLIDDGGIDVGCCGYIFSVCIYFKSASVFILTPIKLKLWLKIRAHSAQTYTH